MDHKTLTAQQTADLILAESYGWQARKGAGKIKAPAQCPDFMKLAAKHSAPIESTSSVMGLLLIAWQRGYFACNEEIAARRLVSFITPPSELAGAM